MRDHSYYTYILASAPGGTLYFEVHGDINHAIKREKNIKKWNRAWKIEPISKSNPDWHEFLPGLLGSGQELRNRDSLLAANRIQD